MFSKVLYFLIWNVTISHGKLRIKSLVNDVPRCLDEMKTYGNRNRSELEPLL